ncbi:Protein suppressor of hairy wing [Gryllus bimaculatus]|nr:Protein suppressor of hairy wing [Gryllus bimaculatus]
MSENVEISYPSEECYETTGVEAIAVVDSAVCSEPTAPDNSSEKIDTFVADIGDKCAVESLNVTESEVHTTQRTKQGTRPEVAPKRRQTVLWEPLLVPTEVDGKYEMVTALKRVDSDYISAPRINPRIVGAQIVKDANLSISPRMEIQNVAYSNPSSKVIGTKGSTDLEFKRGVKKEMAKKKVPDIKISEQMGKAIAEKEAAILKEIEKAMKEANVRNKTVLSDKSAKMKTPSKIVPSQNVKKKESHDAVSHSDTSENSESERDGKMVPSPQNKDLSAVTRVQNVSNLSKSISSSGISLATKEMHGLSKVPTVLGKVVATPSPAGKPLTKETQSTNKMLQVPRTLMISSAGGTVPKDVQAKNKIMCGPATVVSSPTTTAVITTRDTHAVNQVIALPINTNSNPQTLTEISPNTGPRILFLASPTGGLPLLTPILPTTSIPIIQTPVSAPTMTFPRGAMEIVESPRITTSRPRKEKDLSFAVPETGLQIINPESLSMKNSDISRTSSKKPGSFRKGSYDEKLAALSSHNIQLSSAVKVQQKHNKAQSPLHITKGNKNSSKESGDKSALIASKGKSGNSEVSEKQDGTVKSTAVTNITVNGKTAAKKTSIQKNDSQMSVKDQQKIDCNGENMDIDDESVSEELDQGFVDDTRNVNCQNSSGKTKDVSDLEEKYREQKQRKSSKKSSQSESNDRDSQDMLEKRLEKIEQLYNEIPLSKPRLSFSEEEYSKMRDGFRDSMRTIKSITASFNDLISQSSSLSCKGLVHSSSQTETIVETHSSGLNANPVSDEKSEIVDSDLELCRLCGGFFVADSLISLFGKLSKTKDLLSMWTTILPQTTPVKEDDGLPQQVCEACIEKLTLCHSIISQFLQADKELRQVLQDEKPFSTGSEDVSSEGTSVAHPREKELSSGEIVSTAVDNLYSQQSDLETQSCTKESSNEECLKVSEEPTVEAHGQKRRHGHSEIECTNTDKSTPNSKHKRRRNKSSNENESLHATETSAPSGSSSGCIDLSRLDPEFNDGFEVEWCLDEETIRSSMVPEEDVSPGLSEDTAVSTLRVTANGASESGMNLSAGPEGCAESHSGKVELHLAVNPQKKKKVNLGTETPKHTDEVSKLFEVATSVCRSTVNNQNPVSTVHQEKSVVHPNVTQSPTLLKCSSCPLSFHSKQELMLHQVKQHEKGGTSQCSEGKQDSSAIKPKNLPQKQISSSDLKLDSESCEESVMCDQCGLPFPNDYSLCLHKSVIHGTSVNSQIIIKDSKGFEYKIVDSKESLEENATNQEIPEASLSDGKILVKCGSGMLWVNCSKYFSEEQMSVVQSSDLTEVNYVNVENNSVVLTDQNSSTVSPQSVAKVQFAYMCDHCKQVFPSRAELLPHMQIHLKEKYSCSECNAKFASVKALNNHVSLHVPLDRVCDECGLILVDSKKLIQHRKEHTHNLPHVCETCGKRFPNEQTLEVHETVHYTNPLVDGHKDELSIIRWCHLYVKYVKIKDIV